MKNNIGVIAMPKKKQNMTKLFTTNLDEPEKTKNIKENVIEKETDKQQNDDTELLDMLFENDRLKESLNTYILECDELKKRIDELNEYKQKYEQLRKTKSSIDEIEKYKNILESISKENLQYKNDISILKSKISIYETILSSKKIPFEYNNSPIKDETKEENHELTEKGNTEKRETVKPHKRIILNRNGYSSWN